MGSKCLADGGAVESSPVWGEMGGGGGTGTVARLATHELDTTVTAVILAPAAMGRGRFEWLRSVAAQRQTGCVRLEVHVV